MSTLLYQWVLLVIDGDTFKLKSGEVIRLAGVNAAEVGQPFSKLASKKLSELVLRKRVAYRQVSVSYGRIVAHVWVDSMNVNEEMTKYLESLKK